MRTILMWLINVGFFEHGNEHSGPLGHSGPLTVRDSIEYVIDSSFLKSFFAPWRYIFSQSVTIK
jgi:hypothetical protein